jgi:uncharacterized protein with HEPN domain
MNAKVKDSVRILHILDAIKEIEDYIQGADKDSFANNSMMFNATLHQLEIINWKSLERRQMDSVTSISQIIQEHLGHVLLD